MPLIQRRAGLGRTGMIGARLLAELGMDQEAAIKAIRRSRNLAAIETPGASAARPRDAPSARLVNIRGLNARCVQREGQHPAMSLAHNLGSRSLMAC
jgi:hypothetical protein